MWLALLYMLCFQARAVAHASPYRFTWNVVDSSRRKIVEVGMPKSGTSSLQDLLQTLGVKSVHYSE
jgi:chemotaxis response regulator CheB